MFVGVWRCLGTRGWWPWVGALALCGVGGGARGERVSVNQRHGLESDDGSTRPIHGLLSC